MQLVHPAPRPLASKTNSRTTRSLKVHFKLPVIKKAAPTVSVTNTNAARVSAVVVPQSSPQAFPEVSSSSSPSTIPFPSSPIPCPSRKRAMSEDSYEPQEGGSTEEVQEDEPMDVDEPEPHGKALPFHRRISHIDILRRRSKSCLASSYFHSDSHSSRRTHTTHDRPVSPPAEGPARKKPAVRRESMSAGTPTSKTVRKAKRVVADAQFLASMHSSIALQVRTRVDHGGTPGSSDDFTAQDAVLVERIWNALLDMGYRPVPIDAPSPSSASPAASPPTPASSPSTAMNDPAREAAERAARRTMAVSSTPFALDRVQDLPPAPTGTLTVPQLVAVLTMRHRDRTTTRPRSASKKHSGDERPSRSPLSAMILPSSDPMSTS
ncbi:hypothetical protein C8Q76DRAFT_796724 [Earliella scabrosa]|nr:hypothetical protein C8Q76DRAFT_796724 [Earliella scabrosa]